MDIVAVGDAIVDIIATCDDSFLESRGFEKGSMEFLSAGEAIALRDALGSVQEMGGGSAANSMAGAAALGLRTAFVGQVADDRLGGIFAQDMQSLGVRFETPTVAPPPSTGACIILVTPDAQRTMRCCPGASYQLNPGAIDEALIRCASITYLDGYLWGAEQPREAMLYAARIAQASGRTVASTLSQSLAIANRRESVLEAIEAGLIDVLFGNASEFHDLTGSGSIPRFIEALSGKVGTLVITRAAQGSIAISGNERAEASALPVQHIVDTTGAGDQFAAAFLSARVRGRDLKRCLEAGAAAAAEVISHFGARPQGDLKKVVNL